MAGGGYSPSRAMRYATDTKNKGYDIYHAVINFTLKEHMRNDDATDIQIAHLLGENGRIIQP